ncbi:MAG: hypothetical protein HKL90_00375 [Elusimicrobia bacterium]|nr:hypothetical protein [Elusimicrobiota bacterium]
MGRKSARRGGWAFAAALLLRGFAYGEAPAAPDGQVMGTKNDRILWIFPNYMTVDEENSRPRITPRDKLDIAFKDSFDPYAFPVAGIFAGVAQAENQYPSWGRGVDGFEKRYFAALSDQTMSNLMSEGVFPVLLHQDPRYFRLGRGSFLRRAGYSLTRVFVTRADSGDAQFNCSEFGGNAVMAATADLYYPAENRTAGDTAARFGSQIVFDMLADFGKEFWPDIKRRLVGR